jgi:hypothetical protein
LAKLGWKVEEFQDGSKHDKAFSQETVGALQRINEGLIRRQTIELQQEEERQLAEEEEKEMHQRGEGRVSED